MSEDKRELYSDPTKYRIIEGGAVMDLTTKKLIDHLGEGKYQITKDNAGQFAQRRKEIGTLAQMRGLAAARGVALPPDASLEQIAQAAGDGIEALTMHMAQTFTASKNLRGMAESYSKLIAPLVGDQDNKPGMPAYVFNQFNAGDAEMVEVWRDVLHGVPPVLMRNVIDGEIEDIPKGEGE